MKSQNLIVIFLTASVMIMALLSCATKKTAVVQSGQPGLKPYVLKYNRGPCFGECPVYTFYLLDDHTGLVHAKANLMDTAGWYYSNLDQESIVEILELIEPGEWWSQNLGDEPEIADLPVTSITYMHRQGCRKLVIQSRTNNIIENVFGKLNHLVTEGRWIKTNLRPLEVAEEPLTDVIVQLKAGIDINEWMKKFESFGMHLKKRLSPNQQYYLVTKDPAKGDSNDFLQYIKSDPDVVAAQWDRPVEPRKE